MLRRLNLKIFVVLVILFLAYFEENSHGQGNSLVTLYNVSVRIDPVMNLIESRTEIQNPGDSCFIITRSLKINRIIADGRNIQFQQVPSQSSDNSIEITVRTASPRNIIFEYSGQILPDSFPRSVSNLNMIRPGLVELSDYIDWYPRMKNYSPFNFELNLSMPASYLAVTNAGLSIQDFKKSQVLTKWVSFSPVNRITLFAATDLKKAIIEKGGMTVEIYYSKLPVSYVDSMKNSLLKAMELLTDLYGSTGSSSVVRLIYSPRPAGAYARAPIIFVSENYALEQLSQKYGMARDFRLNAHEIAHYWSRASTSTPDDWLNEGLAEFSALLMAEKIIGHDFYKILLDEYLDLVNSSIAETSIAETTSDSRDREINRYYRPTLLLNDLRLKFGDEKMKEFIRSLYVHFKSAGTATTTIFLEEIEKNYGKETRDSFSSAIYTKNWGANKINPEIYYNPADSIFIGKWIGPLTQFGSTTSFVMNLNVKGGKLIALLDSPDQNVMGIPVSELKISGDSISYKIGVASAYFRGIIKHDGKVISGVFTQRGDNYHLDLFKKEEP